MNLYKKPVEDNLRPILRGCFDNSTGYKILVNDIKNEKQNYIFKIEDGTNSPYHLDIKNMCVVNEILTLTKGTKRGAETFEDIINIISYKLEDIDLYKCTDEGHIIYRLGEPVKAEITNKNILKYGLNKIILKKLCCLY